MQMDDTIIERMEFLAKLSLSSAERERAGKEIEKILSYVEKLNELDTDGVEPLVYILPEVNAFREDTVTNEDGRAMALSQAPLQREGQYVVPKTV